MAVIDTLNFVVFNPLSNKQPYCNLTDAW